MKKGLALKYNLQRGKRAPFFFFLFCDERTKPENFQHFPSFFLSPPPPLILFPFSHIESQILSEAPGQFEALLLSYFSLLMMLIKLSFVFGYNGFLSASGWALSCQGPPFHPFMLCHWATGTGNLTQLKKENE